MFLDKSRRRSTRRRYRGDNQSFLTCILPPLLRRNMDLPPPFTEPFNEDGSALPTIVTGRSLETPPPDVLASRLNAQFSGTCTVTPPPEVSKRTSSAFSAESLALMDPPEVEPST